MLRKWCIFGEKEGFGTWFAKCFSTFIDLCCNLFLSYLILRSYEFSLIDSSGEECLGEDHDADRYGLS